MFSYLSYVLGIIHEDLAKSGFNPVPFVSSMGTIPVRVTYQFSTYVWILRLFNCYGLTRTALEGRIILRTAFLIKPKSTMPKN